VTALTANSVGDRLPTTLRHGSCREKIPRYSAVP